MANTREKDVAVPSLVEYSRVQVSVEPPVARIQLHHPAYNVIDLQMMEELASALGHIEHRPQISIVIFRGSPQIFSAGVDIAAHTPDKIKVMLRRFHAVIRLLLKTKKITIAAVRGPCLGGGAELAMMCDLVYTSEQSHWQFPEIKLGCYPPVACAALSALVGQKRAAEMILTGRSFTGQQAQAIGLANEVLLDAEVDAGVEEAAQRVSSFSPAAIALAKKALVTWDPVQLESDLERAEKIYLEELIKTEDAQEGIDAFLQKRKPQWKGK